MIRGFARSGPLASRLPAVVDTYGFLEGPTKEGTWFSGFVTVTNLDTTNVIVGSVGAFLCSEGFFCDEVIVRGVRKALGKLYVCLGYARSLCG